MAERAARRSGWVPVWRRNALFWRKLAAASLLSNLGEPALVMLALGLGLGPLVGEVAGLPYLAFLASGFVCTSAMMTASFEATYSAYTRMAVQHTWRAMITAPLDVADVVLGEVLWAATKGSLSGAGVLLVAGLVGAVGGPSVLLAVPAVALAGAAFAALAMVVTGIARSYDFFLYYTTLVITPMFMLSGVFFPLERMPEAVQTGAWLLPLTHAVALVRPLVVGAPETAWAALGHAAVLAAYAAAGMGIAVRLARRRLIV